MIESPDFQTLIVYKQPDKSSPETVDDAEMIKYFYRFSLPFKTRDCFVVNNRPDNQHQNTDEKNYPTALVETFLNQKGLQEHAWQQPPKD